WAASLMRNSPDPSKAIGQDKDGSGPPRLKLTEAAALSGKSLQIFRNRVKPQNQKYFCFSEAQSGAWSARLTRQEGRSRSSRTCGGMRWTRELRLTSVA